MQASVGSRGTSFTAPSVDVHRRIICHSSHHPTSEQQGLLDRRKVSLSVPLLSGLLLPRKADAATGDWSSPGLNAPTPKGVPQFYKTDSGIRVQETTVGDGIAPQPGDRVLIDYVLRRGNGYFIYATVEGVSFQPPDVPVGPVALTIPESPGDGPMIPGLAEVLLRMRQGGKLRAYIPPELGWRDCKRDEPQPPTFATKRQLCNHNRENLLMEVALRRVIR